MAVAFSTQKVINRIWGEVVTYTRAGVGSTHRLTAGRHILGEEEVFSSFGVYSVRKELYTFASDGVTFEPHLRDTITRAKETKTRVVTDIGGSPFLKFWKVTTAYPSLYDQLDATADVKRAHGNALPDSLGLRDPNETTVYSGVLCRLQPVEREREFEAAGRVVTRSKWKCVFGSAVVAYAGDTVTVGGVVYEVVSQSEQESLGLLTFCDLERID